MISYDYKFIKNKIKNKEINNINNRKFNNENRMVTINLKDNIIANNDKYSSLFNNYVLTGNVTYNYCIDTETKKTVDYHNFLHKRIKSIRVTLNKQFRILYFFYIIETTDKLQFSFISNLIRLDYQLINMVNNCENPLIENDTNDTNATNKREII